MNIAVFFEQQLKSGGGFQQSLSVVELLSKYNRKKYNFIIYTNHRDNINILKKYNIRIKFFKINKIRKLILLIRRFLILNNIFHFKTLNYIEKQLFCDKIDICYFLAPSKIPFFLEKLNYVFTVWDLSHRDMPEFPEVRDNFEFEKRELIYQNLIKKAFAIIADSKVGKNNIMRRYTIDENRVYVAPFLPSKQTSEMKKNIDIRKIFQLNYKYIFYPAQFWAHKNHIYILDSLKILNDKYGKRITAVFIGSDKGNLSYILDYAKRLGIQSQIHYLGFVREEYYANLFQNSLALVMPTYFGPTNIPPLEAFKLEVPVFYSDLPEFRADLGDAVFYFDLKNPKDLAYKLNLLINNKLNIDEKINLGKQHLDKWMDKDYWLILEEIFDNYYIRHKCWKS